MHVTVTEQDPSVLMLCAGVVDVGLVVDVVFVLEVEGFDVVDALNRDIVRNAQLNYLQK